jgi:hypothetical protein
VNPESRSALDNVDETDDDYSYPPPEPVPSPAENPVQKPITAGKIQWCLVGEYKEKRGCVAFTDSDKCLSGQIFPSQQMCLNPTLTPNV